MTRRPGRFTVASLVVLASLTVAAGGPLLWPRGHGPQPPPWCADGDAAAQHPLFTGLVRRYRTDWEERVDPGFRPMIEWQRIVGCHALITGWSDPVGHVGIFVARWDGTDLFVLGLPRVYNGKPVVIRDEKEIPKAAVSSTDTEQWWRSTEGRIGLTASVIGVAALLTVAGTVFLRLRLRGRSRI